VEASDATEAERERGRESEGAREKGGWRRERGRLSTKNVMSPYLSYTFHRILLGHVQRNNKDKDAGRKSHDARPVTDFMDAKNRLARANEGVKSYAVSVNARSIAAAAALPCEAAVCTLSMCALCNCDVNASISPSWTLAGYPRNLTDPMLASWRRKVNESYYLIS